MKNNWKETLGASYDIKSSEVEDGKEDFKNYKKDGIELPNSAKFTGDKIPESGDLAKVEIDTWKDQNAQFEKNKKKEEKDTSHGSSILSEDRIETLDEHIKDEEHVFPNIDNEKIKHNSWRITLADVQVEKKPDGTLKIQVDESTNIPQQQTIQQDQVPEETQTQQEKTSSKVVSWEIKKEGKFSLIGKECITHAGVAILDGDEEIEFHKIAKHGHKWEEVIPIGVYETKFDEIVSKNESKL
jgi:hypothetical protein